MKIKSPNLVFGGTCVALIILFLYLGSLIITNKIFFMSIAIGIGGLSYIKGGIKLGVLVYISSSILGFFLISNKLFLGIYWIFGIYPLIKLIAERYKIIKEYTIKYLALNLMTLATYYIYSNIIYLGPLFEMPYIVGAFIIIQIIFFVFDFTFTKFIMFVEDRVLKRIK